MTKKIITTMLAAFLAVTISAPLTFASEVTGTLSSGGFSTQNNQNSGTISGTVVGGSTSSSGGGGGGGGGTTVQETGHGAAPLPQNNSVASSSSSSAPVIALGGGGPALSDESGGGTALAANGANPETVTTAPDTTDQIADNTTAPSLNQGANIPLAAAAGGAPIGRTVGWILFIILVLALIGYGIYRKYGMTPRR